MHLKIIYPSNYECSVIVIILWLRDYESDLALEASIPINFEWGTHCVCHTVRTVRYRSELQRSPRRCHVVFIRIKGSIHQQRR